MNRPVGAARLAKLPGAVQRINDPDPAGGQPVRIVDRFLGEHRVARPSTLQLARQGIPAIADRLPANVRGRGGHITRQIPGACG